MVIAAPPALSFFVRGNPVTQGSKVLTHRWGPNNTCQAFMREAFAPRLKEWRTFVSQAASRAMKHEAPFAGPVSVQLTFYFPRPASHSVKERQQQYVTTHGRYDVDKLSRAVLDALTDSAIWSDDSQVGHLIATKYYCSEGERPGVAVEVEAL